jgi:uncharacterized protein (DUF362 family)
MAEMRTSSRVGVAQDPARAHAVRVAYDGDAGLDALVREALIASGLGRADGAPVLGSVVPPGASVLMKPNWVYHRNEAQAGLECLNTHPSFILAALRAVAACRPSRILIGDSPIQGCELDWIAGPGFAEAAQRAAGEIPVELVDFRRVRVPTGGLREGRVGTGRGDDRYVLFDLGSESLLEPISVPEGRFRVTMYDPSLMRRSHGPGRHQYLLCREAFEADVFINLPKLKTHRKAGVTIALKNLVGINGNKDYLPHHRIGGSWSGGDCYAGLDPVRRAAEYFLDRANGAAGTPEYERWRRRAQRMISIQRRLGRPTDLEGGWHGNDTCWRMALDLNRLLLHGRADGTIAPAPQRRIISIVDAVVAGQAEGPLAPEPLPLGCVLAGDDSPAIDWMGASLLGLDPAKISLVRESFGTMAYPLTSLRSDEIRAAWRQGEMLPRDLALKIGARARPPAGWRGRCEAAA